MSLVSLNPPRTGEWQWVQMRDSGRACSSVCPKGSTICWAPVAVTRASGDSSVLKLLCAKDQVNENWAQVRYLADFPAAYEGDSLARFSHCFFLFFYVTILYWFCHTLTWIHHGCTCVPHPEPPSHLPTSIAFSSCPPATLSWDLSMAKTHDAWLQDLMNLRLWCLIAKIQLETQLKRWVCYD